MILNLVTIAMLLAITGVWCTSKRGRGFFSAFLAMLCVIGAGAIAFGVWEPVTALILQYAGSINNNLGERVAPTAGLLIPFCIALALLRLTVDSIVKANADFDDATNFIGGMVCGLVTAVITTGTVMVALNFMGVGKSLMGHEHIRSDAGNLVYDSNLWIPADKVTVAVYEHLSTAGFASSRPLAAYAPNLHEQAAMSRMVHEVEKDNKIRVGRAGLEPGDRAVQVKGRMTVKGELTDLLSDRWFPNRAHNVKTISGESPVAGSSSEVIFLEVDSTAAAEVSGQIVFTPGQVRLIATRNDSGVAIHPHAVFAKSEAHSTGLTRFRFDDTNRTIASPGRGGNHIFGFEFLVPPGYTPDSIIVRNVRRSVRDATSYNDEAGKLTGSSARDSAIAGGAVVAALNISMGGIDLPAPTGQPVATFNPAVPDSNALGTTPNLPSPFLNGVPVDRARGLVIVEQSYGRSSRTDNVIRGGRAEFTAEDISGVGARTQLRARGFEQPADQRVLIVELKRRGQAEMSVFGRTVQQVGTNSQPLLYDSRAGRYYQAYGFIHSTAGGRVTIQYDFTKPLRNMSSDLPSMQMNDNGAAVHIVFLVDRNADITDFVLNVEGDAAPRNAVRFTPQVPRIN